MVSADEVEQAVSRRLKSTGGGTMTLHVWHPGFYGRGWGLVLGCMT